MRFPSRRLAAPLVAFALLAGCDDPVEPPGRGEDGSVQILLDVAGAAAAGYSIDNAIVTFDFLDGAEEIVVETPVAGGLAVVEVELRPGQWGIVVELYEGEELVGEGSTTALVVAGFITDLNLEIGLATGGVRLRIHWSDGTLGTIADLTDRPPALEIEGVGSYEVHGLSRIGWDIRVHETPAGEGRTNKMPGRLTYPDVVMLRLTGSPEDITSLALWIDDVADARALSLDLDGHEGEAFRVNLYDVVPIGGNTTIVEEGDGRNTLAGMRISFGAIQVNDYLPTPDHRMPPCPLPGYEVEIEGVGGTVPYCYAIGAIDATPDALDPFVMPSLRDGLAAYQWAVAIREDVEQNACVGCDQPKRAISVITRAAGGAETERTNLYEAWPSRFDVFDPDADHESSFAFGMTLVADLSEPAE